MNRMLSVGILLLASVSQAETATSFMVKMLASPEKTGGRCTRLGSGGQSCAWSKTPYFASAEALLKTKTFYTLFAESPTFKLSEFKVVGTDLDKAYPIKTGALKGSYATNVKLDRGSRIAVRSAESQKLYGY
ncbi:hypothetical protein [Deinococcus sp.]|uniref:hypothetical protein n=1 Tax=Deinococcus sp. TaxID=47478 RepID=UPI0025E193E4|nr:hypothetical protein [Deinococcus sp.]